MKTKLYPTKGNLQYHDNAWVVAKVSPEIVNYYQYILRVNTGLDYNKPKFGSHITVVAGKYENCMAHESWKKYHDSEIYIEYDPVIKENDNTFWLEVHSPWLSEIRQELGLSALPKWAFHITIANRKNLL